jgi:hypothetical protein
MPPPLDAHVQRLRKFWYANARKIVIGGTGGSIILVGVVTIVTPVPSSPVFALGFAILATEFLWAKRFVRRGKAYLKGKLPAAHAARIDRLFKGVAHHSKNIVNLVHHHVIKRLTPRRKRVKTADPILDLSKEPALSPSKEPVELTPEPVKDPLA